MGRAYHFKLHPLTVGELSRNGDSPKTENLMDPNLWIETNSNMCMDIFKQLFVIGGFPEPFLKGDEQEAKRWRINRKDQVLKEDIRDLTQIHNIDKAEHLLDLLVERVGSLISVNSLREDLEVDNKTVSSWIDIFEKLHIIFSIVPYSTKLQRSIKKARKIYFWDWAEVPDPGARFENLVAVHLLKYCDYMKNVAGENLNLRYVRDRNKREVDFLITKNNNPWILLETKYGQTRESANLSYFANKLNIEHRYQITTKKHHSRHVVPCWQILSGLP